VPAGSKLGVLGHLRELRVRVTLERVELREVQPRRIERTDAAIVTQSAGPHQQPF
jgi:hypothetical protein